MIDESRLESLGLIYMRHDMSKIEWAQWVKAYNEHIDKIMGKSKAYQTELF